MSHRFRCATQVQTARGLQIRVAELHLRRHAAGAAARARARAGPVVKAPARRIPHHRPQRHAAQVAAVGVGLRTGLIGDPVERRAVKLGARVPLSARATRVTRGGGAIAGTRACVDTDRAIPDDGTSDRHRVGSGRARRHQQRRKHHAERQRTAARADAANAWTARTCRARSTRPVRPGCTGGSERTDLLDTHAPPNVRPALVSHRPPPPPSKATVCSLVAPESGACQT